MPAMGLLLNTSAAILLTPAFPAAWQHLASVLDEDDARLHALDRGLAFQPDAETRGMLVINKALLLDRRGQTQEAITMLATSL